MLKTKNQAKKWIRKQNVNWYKVVTTQSASFLVSMLSKIAGYLMKVAAPFAKKKSLH